MRFVTSGPLVILMPSKVDCSSAASGWHCQGPHGSLAGGTTQRADPRGKNKGCHEEATLPQPVSPLQVPEATLQEVLPKVLRADLNSVLGSPEHLQLFLLAQQKVPTELEKLMGSVNLFSDENIPR